MLYPFDVTDNYPPLNLVREILKSGLFKVPRIPHIHAQVFKACGQPGAFNMDVWSGFHPSGVITHCRAGWVVELAGEGGRVLEEATSTGMAAALIYLHSDPTLKRIPRFNCSREEALADMKRLALEEMFRILAAAQPKLQDDQEEEEEEEEKELALA